MKQLCIRTSGERQETAVVAQYSPSFRHQAVGRIPVSYQVVDFDAFVSGTLATGHCLLHFATGAGLCTISDGTGALAGFQARVRVTADSSIANLWHWDGTYSFSQG